MTRSMQVFAFVVCLLSDPVGVVMADSAILPPLELPDAEDRALSRRERLWLQGVRLEGNRILSDAQAAELLSPYLFRVVTTDELILLKDRISLWYLERGYVTSGAYLPEQEIGTDGIVRIRVVEGRLGEVAIHGHEHLHEAFYRQRLQMDADEILHLPELEKRLRQLRQHELVERIQADVRPTLTQGVARVDVQVEERSPYRIRMGGNNQGAPGTGVNRSVLGVVHESLLGWGDRLEGEWIHSAGVNDVMISYQWPLPGSESSLHARIGRSTAAVVQEPLAPLDIVSHTNSYQLVFKHRLERNPRDELAWSLGVQHKKSRTELLGVPFDFVRGTDQGESVVHEIDLGGEWIRRDLEQVLALLATLRWGVPWGGASHRPDEPGSDFWAWMGQLHWARRLPWLESQLLLRTAMRLTSHSMLPTEKFILGGMETIRGYREGLLARDSGLFESLEWQVPLPFTWSLPGLTAQEGDGQVSLALFEDWGRNWEKDGTPPGEPGVLASGGMGLLWGINRHSEMALYLAAPLHPVEILDKSSSDRGIHFRLTVGWP
ncbi:MAG: ShlB/FhaC/HecB family hemolysin secretion/activation protein [Magnetococcales bacterium]|nr:ShlB/FhaC/HecB family hemolysin secretion/activation protein [Magnetococcales bacterium]